MSLPYRLVFCRVDRISITHYNGRCQKSVVYIFVVRRGAPPSNCDITKALWREYYSERKQFVIDVNYDFVTSFWRTKAVVTSHFAAITLTATFRSRFYESSQQRYANVATVT